MPSYLLNALETRVLGCLLEKERITPENYPLSLNALVAACNQSTSRDPVTAYDDKTVEAGVNALREKKLATVVFGAGSRVQKYRHNLLDHFELNPREVSLICVLMLRGPQTPGELRTRCERLCGVVSLEEVDGALLELGKGDAPLVRLLPTRPGQKEARYVQLFSEEVPMTETMVSFEMPVPVPPDHVKEMKEEIAALKAELQELRAEFQTFRKQFDN